MKRIDKYFTLARIVACARKDRRKYRVGAIGVRSTDGVVVQSRNGATHQPNRTAHAEARLSQKLTPGSIVFVVRVLRDNSLANARPCLDCQAALRGRGVKKVYYSLAEGEYGVIKFY